jgi:hypothetical protein
MKRLVLNNLTEVIGEIHAPQGPLLANPAAELHSAIENYLRLLERAGKGVATNCRVSEETGKLLEQNLIPEEIYLQQINGFFDSFLNTMKHPYVNGWGTDPIR